MYEQSDTLRSKATLTLLDLISEGEIGGLVDGLKSVYLNETPLYDAYGRANFQGISAKWNNGTNEQEVLQGFGNYIEAPYNVGVQVKKDQPYTFTVSNPNADSVRVIVNFPALMRTDSDDGDIWGTDVQYKFSVSIDNGPFVDIPMATTLVGTGMWTYQSGSGFSAFVAAAVEYTLSLFGATISSYISFADWQAASYAGISPQIVVQPQEWNGSSWQNLGAQVTLGAYWTNGYGDYVTGEPQPVFQTYGVQTFFKSIRFVVVSTNCAGISIVPSNAAEYGPTPTVTVSGKARSRYQRAHIVRFSKPSANSDVRIRFTRLSDDSTSSLLNNDTYLDSYSEIVSLNMVYPNSALFGLRIDSQQFNQVPQRAYLVDGLKIRVPINYDPVAGAYAGTWNGVFKRAVSNNPAWVLFDVLTNDRYGLGQFISDSQIDKAALYSIGKYCDELVPNGFGGYERRFSVNVVINSAAEAYKFISDITSVFRGMSYWNGGMVKFTQDSPTDATMLYSPANVVDGMFNYTGSSRKDRHSVVHVTWNDPEDFYRKKVEYVEDAELISTYGVKKLDTLAFGCTSRGQAARVGKWILYTEKFESDLISFKVGLDSALVEPGDVIKIHDPNRAGKRSGGRITNFTLTSATLDSPVTIASTPAVISIMLSDGTFADRTILQGVGTWQTVTWTSELLTPPVASAMWMISEPNLEPVLARVIGISQGSNPTEFEISALEHNPAKYAAIEQGLTLQDRKTSIIDVTFVQTPTQLTVRESIYKSAPGVFPNKLFVSWSGDCTQYDLSWRGSGPNNSTNLTTVRVQNALSYEILDVPVGPYEISVVGINPLGKRSSATTVTYTVLGNTTPPSDVASFAVRETEQGAELSWVAVDDIDIKTYELRTCDTPGQSWESATYLTQTVTPIFLIARLYPIGTYEWLVKAVDVANNYSTNATRASLTVLAPLTPSISSSYSQSNLKLTWASCKTTYPIDSYEIRQGATWNEAVLLGHVTAETFSIAVNWSDPKTFWVIARDIAGNLSAPSSIIPGLDAPTISIGASPTISGSQYKLTWTGSQGSLPISRYEIRYGASWAAGTTLATTSSSFYSATVDWLGSRTFWVAPIDTAGLVGTAASTSLNITAPSAPVPTFTITGTSVALSWPTPAAGSLDIAGYEVRYGSGSFASASFVSELKSNSISIPITWVGDRTFQVVTKDVVGNMSSAGTKIVTISVPAAPTLSHSFTVDQFNLFWTVPSATLPIEYYKVGLSATYVQTATSIVVTLNDHRYLAGSAITLDVISGGATSGDYIVQSVTTNTFTVTSAASANLSGTASITQGTIKGTSYSTKANWGGTRTFNVLAFDANGNAGARAQYDVTVNLPGQPSITPQVVDNNVLLYWVTSQGTLPIIKHSIRMGGSWDSYTRDVGDKSGTFTTIFETAAGFYTYWVSAYDSAGNRGPERGVTVKVDQPPDYVLNLDRYSDFNGRNFEFSAAGNAEGWTTSGATISVSGDSLVLTSTSTDPMLIESFTGEYFYGVERPMAMMRIRRVAGSGWQGDLYYSTDGHGYSELYKKTVSTGPAIGETINLTWDMTNLTAGGNDWVNNRINSVRFDLGMSASDVFEIEWIRFICYTSTNALLEEQNSVLLPVNTTETFAQHFTTRSWTNPDAQIGAGYPVYIQPTLNPGVYTEIVDFGATLPASKVSITPTVEILASNPTYSIQISTRASTSDPWSSFDPGITSIYASGFRYVKVEITVTNTDSKGLIRLKALNIRFDSKLKNDAGMASGAAVDSVSGTNAVVNGVSGTNNNPLNSSGVRVTDGQGTLVRFNSAFTDIAAIDVSLAAGTTAKYIIYDFVDTPNPAGFKVLMYDESGTRVGGNFSWSVKGY